MDIFSDLVIRRYRDDDFAAVSKLFYETVHSVNAKDYSAAQLDAWAPNVNCLQTRRADLLRQNTLIAQEQGVTVGFGSVDGYGCLDMLFVHRDFQRRGIAAALCGELEYGFSVVKVYASVTAKPFFEKRGYAVVTEQEAERFGVKLKNYEMVKRA